MAQSYKKQIKLKNNYDAILIGSGMGSLTAGALLAKEGKQVLILEKQYTHERFRQKFLQPRTPIKGLYLTGQDIVTAGVGGALFAGLITSSAITGINFMKKIYQ